MHRPTEIAAIKAAVRRRDGFRCTRCGITAEEHLLRYKRTLEVHRVVPGSLYAFNASCVTLCKPCHFLQPKQYGGFDLEHPNVRAKIDATICRKARTIVAFRNVPLAKYLTDLLTPLVEKDYRTMQADMGEETDGGPKS